MGLGRITPELGASFPLAPEFARVYPDRKGLGVEGEEHGGGDTFCIATTCDIAVGVEDERGG